MSDSDATKTYHINSDMSMQSESTENSKPLHDIKYSAIYFNKFWHNTKRDNFRRSFSCPELPIKNNFHTSVIGTTSMLMKMIIGKMTSIIRNLLPVMMNGVVLKCLMRNGWILMFLSLWIVKYLIRNK